MTGTILMVGGFLHWKFYISETNGTTASLAKFDKERGLRWKSLTLFGTLVAWNSQDHFPRVTNEHPEKDSKVLHSTTCKWNDETFQWSPCVCGGFAMWILFLAQNFAGNMMVPLVFSERNPKAQKKVLKIEVVMEKKSHPENPPLYLVKLSMRR